MKSFFWIVWCVMALVHSPGCSKVDVFRLTPLEEVIEIKEKSSVTTEGNYCASDPKSIVFPVKIMFVLDASASMADSDANFRRLTAAKELIAKFVNDPNVLFSVIRLQGDTSEGGCGNTNLLITNPIFTKDQTLLSNALDQGQHAPDFNTPYVCGLDESIKALKADILTDTKTADRTHYIFLWLSDGAPTDEIDMSYQFPMIQAKVKELKNQEIAQPRAGKVTLNTAYLRGSETPGQPVPPAEAIKLLQKMAELGDGQFINFENNEAIDFTQFQVSSISRDFQVISSIFVTNLTGRLTPNGYEPDSDLDGLLDSEELALGTDPTVADTDGDSCSDFLEVKYFFSDPKVPGNQANPRHCDCLEELKGKDTDGDMLNDCEEYILRTFADKPDSDVNIDDKSDPDHILDYFEIVNGTARRLPDASMDNDNDSFSNMEEIRTHMDPNFNDNALREEFAYLYEENNSIKDGMNCWTTKVSNIHLANTLETKDHKAGENIIGFYFIEAPQDNPLAESQVRYSTMILTWTEKMRGTQTVQINSTDFKNMGETTDDPNPNKKNRPPIADAGSGQVVRAKSGSNKTFVTVDGSGSFDPDGTIEMYLWTENNEKLTTEKIAEIPLTIGKHTLQLEVTDDQGATARSTVGIEVKTSLDNTVTHDSQGGGCASAGFSFSDKGFLLTLLAFWFLLKRWH